MPTKLSGLVLLVSLALAPLGCGGGQRSSSIARIEASTGSQAELDREITRQIRTAVRSDTSLSASARSITIITMSSVVLLRGHVSSSREREVIGRHASTIAGVRRVDNALSVGSGPSD